MIFINANKIGYRIKHIKTYTDRKNNIKINKIQAKIKQKRIQISLNTREIFKRTKI